MYIKDVIFGSPYMTRMKVRVVVRVGGPAGIPVYSKELEGYMSYVVFPVRMPGDWVEVELWNAPAGRVVVTGNIFRTWKEHDGRSYARYTINAVLII